MLNASAGASRAIRFFSLLCLLALLTALAPSASLADARAGSGGLGQALALMASLHNAQRPAQVRAAAPGYEPGGLQRTPNGRVLLGRGMMRPGALRGNATTGSSTVPIPGAVQTFDANNPAPAFQPLIGYSNPDNSLGNNPANAPIFQKNNTLAPTNLTPLWSADEKFLIFSSNRTLQGDVNTEGPGGVGSRFHLWAISVNGGEAFQITTSAATIGENPTIPHGEFFPTLAPTDIGLAFTSDAQSSGTQNLFILSGFNFSSLLARNNTVPFQDVSNTDTTNGGILSVTLRAAPGQTTFPTETQSATLTGFDQVQRPTFLGTSTGELAFSARSVSGANPGRNHLYFLFTSTGGSDPNNTSYPGQLTDGSADDTDPASSKDGQFVAFASTATSLTTNTNGGPGAPPSLTSGGTLGGVRTIFLVGGGGTTGGNGLGVVPTFLQQNAVGGRIGAITAAGTDNFGPAWSFNNVNQFTNPSPGFEYIAFARGASQAATHDIYYVQAVRFVNAGGSSAASIEAATTPVPLNTPVYQINAGDTAANEQFGNYLSDNNTLFNNGQGFFTGGTAEVLNPAPNVTNDPTAPSQIYLTDRHGAMSYTLPNLTPDTLYTVRLHFSDPTNTLPGQRIFNVTANGVAVLSNFDIIGASASGNGELGGLISSGGTAVGGATVTFTDPNTGQQAAAPVTTTTTTRAGPDGNPINYAVGLAAGSYTVTVTANGFSAQSQTVSVSNNVFTRADFAFSANNATVTGTVTNVSTTASLANVPVTVTNANNVVVAGPVATDGNGNYTLSVPAGAFNVTAHPTTNSGVATLTQNTTFTAGNTTRADFALASAGVGTVGGLVSVNGQTAAGLTVQVQGNGYRALVTTGTASTPTPGDGSPQNYNLNLPAAGGTAYTVTVSGPGFVAASQTVTAVAGVFKRLDLALTRTTNGTGGPNTAVVTTFSASTAAATDPVTGQAYPRGQITLNFTPLNPAQGDPIVEGIEVLSGFQNGSVRTPSSGFGAFTTAVNPSAPLNLRAIGDFPGGLNGFPVGLNGNGVVRLTFNAPGGTGASLGTPTSYSVFRSAGAPTNVNQPGGGGGLEGPFAYLLNVQPAVNGTRLTLFDQNAVVGNEYFYTVAANFQEEIVPEGATPLGATAANGVVMLNTDDNSGETTASASGGVQQEAAQNGNTFDDVYPAWSPGLSIFSIAYQGGGFSYTTGAVTNNRTVTYNDPATSFPSETAISVSPGGVVHTADPNQTSYNVGAAYTGIFESQVLNLDPPTLLRYNPDEIIHVQAGNIANPIGGVATKVGIGPSQKVTFTIRLTDREAGIDNGTNTDGSLRAPLNGGPTSNVNVGPSGTLPSHSQIFLQIKDPNSKYQDSQNLEHKVFAKDSQYNGQANQATRNDLDSGTANIALGLGFNGYETDTNIDFSINFPRDRYRYPPFGSPTQITPVIGSSVVPRGTHGGHWTFPDTNNPFNAYIFTGKAGGGINPGGEAGGDPALFIPHGPEYECQLVNPQFANSGNPNAPADVSPADFRNPYWLAGVDDQQPFGGVGKTRPIAQNGGNPAEWFQMVPSPVQDQKGGVLYTVTWTTPASASDFFLDVIAYDQAVFPGIPPGTSSYVGKKVNWRIYDNVGGFSTVQNLTSANSILVISDNALGQKFAATTFAGRNSNLNLTPKLFGAESYLTDVDVSTLPDVNYAGTFIGSGAYPYQAPFLLDPTLFTFKRLGDVQGQPVTTQNGLGVGSYYDPTIDDGERRDGAPDLPSQRYTIYRTLSRGPVTDAILAGYLPSKELQPAINDPDTTSTTYSNVPAATILNAPRCVIWLSPFTGDLLTDPGSLNDPGTPAQNGNVGRPSTQTVLRNFVLGDGTVVHPGGGRLFLTGQDAGATLTINGTSGNTAGGFLPDVLNATEVTPGGGSNVLAATANRITGSPFYDNTVAGRYLSVVGDWTVGFRYISPFYPYQDNLILGYADVNGLNDTNDAALDQVPALTLSTGASIQGRIDTIAPTNGAAIAATYGAGGPAAMVFHDDPYRNVTQSGKPNTGTGSRTVYAAFGIEAMGSDYFASIAPALPGTPIPPPVPPPVIPRNPRQAILHNIVCYLRTATVTGVITQTAGPGVAAGTPVSGVTVYLRPTGAAPATRVAFSAATGSDGRYTINGIEPGTYTLVAYKSGFSRTVGNNGTAFTLEGGLVRNNGTLTLTALNPGSIAGNVIDKASKKPIVGATVTFTSTDKTTTKSTQTRTGLQAGQPAGSYFVDNVPVATYTAVADGPVNDQGTAEYVEAKAPDVPFDTGVPVLSNATTQPVNFTLVSNPVTLSGRVFNTSLQDNAAGGLPAIVTLTDAAGNQFGPVTAAADGTYSLTITPATAAATTYTITATYTGFAQATTVAVTAQLGDTITNADVGLTPLGTISGRIYDNSIGNTAAGGASAGRATVTLTDSTGKVVAIVSANPTSASKTDGTYSFTGVQPGTYTITAVKVGFATTNNTRTMTVVLGSVLTGQDIGLAPIQPGSITGTVTDANGAGIAGALVSFVSADGTATLSATADANGNYSLPTVFPGTYNGTATGPINLNGRPTTTQGTATVVVASAPAKATVNFSVVTIPPSFAGTVTDAATKKPLASALVTITDTATGNVIKTIKTGADGKYSSGPLAPSTYTISASLVGYATQALKSQAVYNGDALTDTIPSEAPLVDIALVPAAPGSVTGQVTDANGGGGVARAIVTITSTDGTQTLVSGPTDANGNYSIPTVGTKINPSGNYTATVTVPTNAAGKPEFSPAPSQSITIPANGTRPVNFVLTEILATLSGTVTDNQTGKPIAGATVTLTDSTGRTIGTPQTTAADGTFTFTAIPASQTAASFSLSATAPGGYSQGFRSPTPSITLGDTLTGQNIGLDELGTITGLVTDGSNGQPLPNVALTVTDTTTKAAVGIVTPTTALITTPGTSLGPDGKTSNYTATFILTPGHSYAVTASKANYNQSAAVPVTPAPLTLGVVGRADIKLSSGIGTLGGLVSDATTTAAVGGATVTVSSVGPTGATTVVATFTTNGSVSPAPDGGNQGLNYSGQVAQGSYAVTLSFGSRTPVTQKVTVIGGQFNRLDFTGAKGTPPIFTFPSNLQFVSTPYDYSAIGFDALFGIINTAPTGTPPNGNRTHVAVWDPTVSQYMIDPNAPADTLRLGVGYWVFLKNPVPVTVQGGTPSGAFVPVVLHPTWNQIGVPNPSGVPVSSLKFDNGAGGMITFAQAISTQYHVADPTLYSYDGNAYQPVTQSSVLQPWKAYWIKVFSGATLEIPTR